MKKPLLFWCLLALCNLMLLAQSGERPRAVPGMEKSAIQLPPQEVPPGLKVIYNNLGKKGDLYYSATGGWPVSGQSSANGSSFVAMPFTPKANSHVSQAQVAVQYASGDNQVNLSIYADAGGTPGALLTGPVTVTNLPNKRTCCGLAIASFSPVAVSSGTQYWVVADAPSSGPGSNFIGPWEQVAKVIPGAANRGSGWYSTNDNTLPAGEVLGTIP